MHVCVYVHVCVQVCVYMYGDLESCVERLREHTCQDPIDAELYLRRVASAEILVGLLAILPCKPFNTLRHSGEKPIEPSKSWFPPEFPSGLLELNSSQRVVQMNQVFGNVWFSTFFSYFNLVSRSGSGG